MRGRKRQFLRRKRTPTYDKQAVFSYRSSRNSVERSMNRGNSEIKATKGLNWWVRRVPYLLCALALIAAFVYSLIVDSNAKLVVVGEQSYLRKASEYQSSIDESLQSSVLYRFKPTLNTTKITQDIQNQFPELQEVVVKLPLLRHRPVVEFRLASPAAVIESGSDSYVIDGQGRALFNLRDKSASIDASDLPYLTDNTGAAIILGQPALSEDQVSYIRQIFLQAKKKSVRVENMILRGGGQQLDVRFRPDSYYVKFNLLEDARQSVGTYFALRKRLLEEGNEPSKYIDVRVPEKAFVR